MTVEQTYEKFHALVVKYKGETIKPWTWQARYETVPYKQPIAILLKNDKTIEIIEDCTGKKLKFIKSDGSNGEITLSSRYLWQLPYGENPTSAYICHEDHYIHLPADPINSAEDVSNLINKIFTDAIKYQTQLEQEKGMKPVYIAIAIGLIIASIGLFAILAPDAFNAMFGWKKAEAAKAVAQNISNATQQIMIQSG